MKLKLKISKNVLKEIQEGTQPFISNVILCRRGLTLMTMEDIAYMCDDESCKNFCRIDTNVTLP